MSEGNVQRLIQIAASERGHRLMRINVGLAYVGDVARKTPHEITLRNWRPFKAATAGTSDLMGWTRDGRFVAIEVKSPRGRLSDEQAAFIASVMASGGLAGVARSVEDALAILEPATTP